MKLAPAYDLGAQVYKIVATIMDHDIAKRHFNEQLDSVRLGTPDCLDAVKEALDLGTIRKRLIQGYYVQPYGVYTDVHLVWHNCRTYNDPDSEIVAECNQLASIFERLWRQLDFGAEQNTQSTASVSEPLLVAETLPRAHTFQQKPVCQQELRKPSLSCPTSQSMQTSFRHKPAQAAAVGAAVVTAGAQTQKLRGSHPLARCLAVLEQLLEAMRAIFDPDRKNCVNHGAALLADELIVIKNCLAPGLQNGWGTIPYKSTADVLSDIRRVLLQWQQHGSDACREAGKKAEHEFFRLWQAAALPLDECSAASGEAHELGPTPNSPTSLLSPRDSMTASFLSGKGHKKPSAQRSMTELSSGRAISGEHSITPGLRPTAIAKGVERKRQRQGQAPASSGQSKIARCDVCVRSKKGRCGTATALQGCRNRQQAKSENKGANQNIDRPVQDQAGPKADSAVGAARKRQVMDPEAYARAALDAAAASGIDAQCCAEVAAQAAGEPKSLLPTFSLSPCQAAFKGLVSKSPEHLPAKSMIIRGNDTLEEKLTSSSKPGQYSATRDKLVLATWLKLQKKKAAAKEAISAAHEAATVLAEAQEALQAIEHRENAQAQTISEETLTEWPPGAKFVPEDYDVMASNAAVKQRHLASIMKLGCHWLYSDGPAAAAFFAARTAGTAAKQLMGPKLQPAMPCIPRVGLSETNDQMAFKQPHAVQDKNEYLV